MGDEDGPWARSRDRIIDSIVPTSWLSRSFPNCWDKDWIRRSEKKARLELVTWKEKIVRTCGLLEGWTFAVAYHHGQVPRYKYLVSLRDIMRPNFEKLTLSKGLVSRNTPVVQWFSNIRSRNTGGRLVWMHICSLGGSKSGPLGVASTRYPLGIRTMSWIRGVFESQVHTARFRGTFP